MHCLPFHVTAKMDGFIFFPCVFQGGIANLEYFATGTQRAMQYFNLNPTTGEISAKQSLQNDVSFGNDEYTVRFSLIFQ